MNHSDQQNWWEEYVTINTHPEHIQTFQNNLKRGLWLAGFKYEVCKKLQEKIENKIIK